MEHLICIAILVINGYLLTIHMILKPLSEDDGNWFYLPVFWKRGVRLYKNIFAIYGYFGVHWVASCIYNLFGFTKPSFFQYYKAVWYILNALSIYWLVFCFWQNHTFACIAGLLFIIITAVPNTLFFLTYAEHLYILPINLSILSVYSGITTGSLWYFVLAGLLAGWAFQIKPTALLFSILLLAAIFYFTPGTYTALVCYITAFITLNAIPLVILSQYDKNAQKQYLILTFGPFLSLLLIILRRFKLEYLVEPGPKNFKLGTLYMKTHHNQSFQVQWTTFKISMLPSIKDLYSVLILAVAQVGFLFVNFDPFIFSMVLLFIIFLLTQQFQKNYYTPHFNTCWAPISILAAKTIYDMWPYLLNSGVLGWAMIAFMGVESIKIGRIIIKSFLKSERDTFGYKEPLLGTLFRFCESIGEYIQQNSKENDKLFVWGDQPSIYLYAKREAFDTDYLFTYLHRGHIFREKEFLDSLREKPPELLLFYNYKVNDGWNINKLQETIGITYNLLKSFQIKNDQGKILFSFPLYRRNDSKYREILLERAFSVLKNGDIDASRMYLATILEIFPNDYEALAQLSLLENSQGKPDKIEEYLKRQLSENHDSEKCSVIFRMLADEDVKKGNFNKAKENFEKAVELKPDDFKAYNGLGEIYFASGNMEKALFFFKKAFELNRYSADILNNLGVICMKSGNKKDSIDFFKVAASIMPSHNQANENLKYCSGG